MPTRKYRRDQSEVSCCLKYVIFGFNVIFWVSGLQTKAFVVLTWKFTCNIFKYILIQLANWSWYHGCGNLGLDRKRYVQQSPKTYQCGFRSSIHTYCNWSCHLHYWFHRLCWCTQRKHLPSFSCKHKISKSLIPNQNWSVIFLVCCFSCYSFITRNDCRNSRIHFQRLGKQPFWYYKLWLIYHKLWKPCE